jgi:hypothetical protein
MISHDHGNDPYSQSGCGARGEAANSRLTAAIACFHGGAMFGHVWARPQADAEADIETCSFDFRACVVP